MIQSNCANCGSKKSRFIKEQQAMGILSNLGIKTPLNKIPLLNILFEYILKRSILIVYHVHVVDTSASHVKKYEKY